MTTHAGSRRARGLTRVALASTLVSLALVPAVSFAATRNGRVAVGTSDVYTYDGSDYENSGIVDFTSTGREERSLWNACGPGEPNVCPTDVRSPTYSHDGTRIALDHGNRLATMNADGSAHYDLPSPNEPQYPGRPTWSPSDQNLAFTLHGDLYAVRADGTNQRLLVRDAQDPTWSSRNRIAYRSEHHPGIWILNPASHALHRLTRGNDSGPAWSSDGRRLAFSRSPEKSSSRYDVYVTGTGSHGPRRLVSGSGGLSAWAPDGRSLLLSTAKRYPLYRVVDLRGHTRRTFGNANHIAEHVGPTTWQPLP